MGFPRLGSMGNRQKVIGKSGRNARQLVNTMYWARTDQLKDLRRLVRSLLGKEGYKSDFIRRMVLAVNEASANIIKHAYTDSTTEKFRLEILTDDVDLMFRLTDSAPTLDKSAIKPRALDDIRPGGLGVHFIYEIMDDVEFLDASDGLGNIMQMTKGIE